VVARSGTLSAVTSPAPRIRAAAMRLVAIADQPGDDDDIRLRKRVGVIAGYVTIVAPLGLPLEAPSQPIAWLMTAAFSAFSAANLALLARSRRFERYVVGFLILGPLFVLVANVLGGGVTTSSAGLVWAFLGPAYALLALGPHRATPWYFVFLGAVLLAVMTDPLVRGLVAPPPYAVQLGFYAQNVAVPLTIAFLLLRYTDLRRRAAEARSEELLTNAIPASIAARLKHGEERIAERYPATTVVFVDIAGFTPWAQRTDPGRVVALLDDLFSRLDAIVAELGLEKIKTVGDAYMAVAGAPHPRPDHATAGVAFGRTALAEADAWRRTNGLELEVRVGVASGPVVGGVIGRRRILFDLWGDTVNTAARMESSGVPGRIQLAASTGALLDDDRGLEERSVDVKGLGQMTTYLVGEAAEP